MRNKEDFLKKEPSKKILNFLKNTLSYSFLCFFFLYFHSWPC